MRSARVGGLKVVGHLDDLNGEGVDEGVDVGAPPEVEEGRRFVGHQDARLDGEHPREGEELPLSPGKGVDGDVGVILKPNLRESVESGRCSRVLVLDDPPERERDVLDRRRHDELGGGIGEEEPDVAPHGRGMALGYFDR